MHETDEYSSTPSGGTLATILGLFESFELKELIEAGKPYSISPIPGPKVKSKAPWYTPLIGIRSVSDLGTLTTSLTSSANAPVVQRTWGLLHDTPETYGDKFYYSEYMKARNVFLGIVVHIAFALTMLFLALKPVRWLVAKKVYQPGEGVDRESAKKERIEYRGIAEVEDGGRAFVRAQYDGGLYYRKFVIPFSCPGN